ncbi:Sensor histidine kinase YycG [Rubripirellula lacrimiformis]|uniref:histidine kinase n=1 Tax=Rubripirellula lacrimiformis TaxID=1930273 RepID=A0A517NI09_9BACT|nr:HAMP domain-containing sensor histidine kinase [Rubripirellula lacrimiformis]QDT06693.1 Sensor histidine kinase YycG [Rubripirellula lacrimiformis]
MPDAIQMIAGRSGETSIGGEQAVSSKKRRAGSYPLSTTRVGLASLAVSICVLVCTFAASVFPVQTSVHSMLWITALAACCVGGLVAMGSIRTLRTIETELRRCQNDVGSTDVRLVRPVIGSDPIADGWNGLLDSLKSNAAAVDDRSSRPPATLDREAITLARAMRGLPTAWVVTDINGLIRFVGPVACGLLQLDESKDHTDVDLLGLLALRGGPSGTDDPSEPETSSDQSAEDAAADQVDIERLLGPIRMVHCRRVLKRAAEPIQLRITRSRLTGRSGDVDGLAWVLADVTQQSLATEARDQFLMTATHELRTPLSNLQAYAEMLVAAEEMEVDQQKDFCNIINSEANRLGRLVDQLLTVSQMEAGSMVANRHELELLPLIHLAAEQVEAHAVKKSIAISTRILAKSPICLADRDKLQAALVNLVGNAVKYTPEGGEVVLRLAADDRWIRIDVEDNGPGIPEDEQEKVFEKFYRCVGTREAVEQGNGLGLAFAREIARLHGGDLELRSSVGEGCVFTLRLPVMNRSAITI